MEVSLSDILAAREERVRLQQQYLHKYRCPLISFTMNIAGPIKNTPLIQRGFQEGLDNLRARLTIRAEYVEHSPTGCTAMLSVAMAAKELKAICVELEETSPIGRLFDMDVLDIDGTKLERPQMRSCIVCGAPGRGCAARRVHSVTELQNATNQLLRNHFLQKDPLDIAARAVSSLIDEVNTTPKPGLVDLRNNGSHRDMDPELFRRSAIALHRYFAQCVKIGQATAASDASETFPLLREEGLRAEKEMFQVTCGVNTHKGAIYTMGILCGSIGRLWKADKPIGDIDAILSEARNMVSRSVHSDLASANGSTNGEKCYLRYGLGGIRQEVADGLPSVREIGLPRYEKALADGYSPNDAGAIALIHLIAQVADTNLYHRGGETGAKWAAKAAASILPEPNVEEIIALDDSFIARNLSPGGCADLLAVTYFLHKLK